MNPKLENVQFLGAFGIIKESFKLINQWKRIFTQITLAFILPLYLLAFANIAISLFSLTKINNPSNPIPPSQIIFQLIFNIISPILSIIFSLFSTTTVVYTVACIYAADVISFKHVIAVVPKVWKRLLVTVLCVFVALFAFDFVLLMVILSIVFSISGPKGFTFEQNNKYMLIIVFILMVFLFVGNFYLSLIWKLSSVVSVLEEMSGFKAMGKSKDLVKGKMRMMIRLYMMLGLPLGVIQYVFLNLGINNSSSIGVVGISILVIIWALLFSFVLLVVLVATTVLYFVCKSYHNFDHLDQRFLMPDYVSLEVDDDDHHVQIQKLQIV